MKIKLNLETLIYAAVVVLCLAVLALIWSSSFQFSYVKPVYQGF